MGSCEQASGGEGCQKDQRMFSKLSKSFKGSVSSLLSEDQPRSVGGGYGGGRVRTEVGGFAMGRRKERRRSRIFSQIFSSDAEDTKSDVPTRSMSMHSLDMEPVRSRTGQVAQDRFDSLEEKMVVIQEALARTSSCVAVDRIPGVDGSMMIQLRRELSEKNRIIKRLKERSENCDEFSDTVTEIEHLRN